MEKTPKEKSIKDYLHLYLCGQAKLYVRFSDGSNGIVPFNSYYLSYPAIYPTPIEFKLVLRPLSEMRESEEEEIGLNRHFGHTEFHPIEFAYLLSRGFDLFGLIKSGLAIKKATL